MPISFIFAKHGRMERRGSHIASHDVRYSFVALDIFILNVNLWFILDIKHHKVVKMNTFIGSYILHKAHLKSSHFRRLDL